MNYKGGTDPHVTASEFVSLHNLEKDPQAHDDIVTKFDKAGGFNVSWKVHFSVAGACWPEVL